MISLNRIRFAIVRWICLKVFRMQTFTITSQIAPKVWQEWEVFGSPLLIKIEASIGCSVKEGPVEREFQS